MSLFDDEYLATLPEDEWELPSLPSFPVMAVALVYSAFAALGAAVGVAAFHLLDRRHP